MQVAVFGAKPYDRTYLSAANAAGAHRLVFHEPRLSLATAALAAGAEAVCLFVNDQADEKVLGALRQEGIRLAVLRCAGYDNVDLGAARRCGIAVARVPSYSPHAVAEHAVGLMLALDRKIHRAYNRVREGNFSLDGLLGFNLHGRTVGIIGTGGIGSVVARILIGFGCVVIAQDPVPVAELEAIGVAYVDREALFARSDIVTLHCPLNAETRHLVNAELLAQAKRGFMLVNTGRGALIDTRAVIAALKHGQIGQLALDVYEGEAGLFFEDMSGEMIRDDVFARLLTFPNVLITGHQAFFTEEALTAIAATTIGNIDAFVRTGRPLHPLT
ncbi:MAG: 2-hydroxyacid dehydrogenase [Bauldia sp.]|nr:2-hydroxyacid dehydrogenase [Bauldia sp.]